MQLQNEYDAAIIGGGLAGLAASIQLGKRGHSVILFEKEKYPFHKVCGEYVSMESWNFLRESGLPLEEMNLPRIDSLMITGPNGKAFETRLPLGGFGISRFKLDALLAENARQNGVHLVENTKIDDAVFDNGFRISFQSKMIGSKTCCAAYGKRSNLDVKWKRGFLKLSKGLENYVGVKYHIRTNWKPNVIGLHNFENGYCGISKIEEDKYCLCYMTGAGNLKKCDNSIPQLEERILYKNPHLKKIFLGSEKCGSFPVTISQINFNKKTQIENGILMLGDCAGLIAPLCGNGMSIALHTAKIAADAVTRFLEQKISRGQMEEFYRSEWEQRFAKRLKTGRTLQRFFGSGQLSNLFIATFRAFPFLSGPVIKMTHGEPF